jgi:hypothetical protein
LEGSIGLTFGLSHHSKVILFKTTQARDKVRQWQ